MSDGTGISARDVAEAILELTREALLTGDCDTFCAVFHTPLPMAVSGETHLAETVEDLRQSFWSVFDRYKSLGVTDLDRSVTHAEFTSPDRIETTHTSRRIIPDAPSQEMYPVFSVIERIGHDWKVTSVQYAIDSKDRVADAIVNPRAAS